jgi:hypothetical protein
MERIRCCFPGKPTYVVRAANQWVVRGARLLTDIIPGAGKRCVKDCSPRRARLKNRVFEIASSSALPDCKGADTGVAHPTCFIGAAAGNKDDVCVVNSATDGVKPSSLSTELPAGCVFDSLKGRFAIYRGLKPSTRDMAFSWTVNGGFTGLAVSMANTSTGQSVMPQNMVYSESLDALVVVDGVSGGLSLFGLLQFQALGDPYL